MGVALDTVGRADSVGAASVAAAAGIAACLAGAATLDASSTGPRGFRAVLLLAAVVAATPLALRQSTVVIILSIGAIVTLLVSAATNGLDRGARLGETVGRTIASLGLGPRWMLRPAAKALGTGRGASLVRSLLVAVVAGGALLLALAAADPVFAAILGGFEAGPALGRSLTVSLWFAPVAGLVFSTVAGSDPSESRSSRGTAAARVLRAEGLVGMVAIAVVLGAWGATQVSVALGGADHILETAGLTRAEYARSGFFQLVFTAALILILLWTLESVTKASPLDRWFAGATALVTLETLALVIATAVRLSLYTDAFGLTVTRVVVAWFLCWLALVIVRMGAGIVASRTGTRPGCRPITARFVVLTATLAITVFGWWNPEARIASVNLQRSDAGAEVDLEYLTHLSADGLIALDQTNPVVRGAICGRESSAPWWNPNRSRSALTAAQDRLSCDSDG